MSTDDPSNGTTANASERKILANQKNAKRSTGPRSAAGKLAVTKNGIGHGIYALCPVIKHLESARDWKRYCAAMLTSLAPVGMLETTLAERIILTAWRQRRAVRYEAEAMRLSQERAPEVVCAQLGLETETAARAVDEILSDAKWRMQSLETVLRLADTEDETALSPEDAENLLSHVCAELGFTAETFDDHWQQLPEPEAWTVGLIRQLARAVAEQHGKSFDELLAVVRDKAVTEAIKTGRVATPVKRHLDEYRRENLLPDNETLEKVMRYEAHLSRLFHRDLHELQRLQAPRNGQPVAAPIAIDVDVTGGAKPLTEAARNE